MHGHPVRTVRTARRRVVAATLTVLAVTAATATVLSLSANRGALAAPVPGQTQHGRATMNSLGESGLGNCSFQPSVIANKMYTAAPPGEYDSSGGCGSYVDVTGSTGKTVRVQIVDKCPECEPGHLDMSPESFRAIAPAEGGVQQISYTAVRDPALPAPIQVRVQDGSTAYWIGFLISNHGNPLTSVEYRDADGAWRQLTRTVYNYWHKEDGAGAGPFTLRLTDVYGRQVVVDDIAMKPNVDQDTGIWMYQGGTPGPSAGAANTGASNASQSNVASSGAVSVLPKESAALCSATLTMAGSWPDGYQASLKIRNDGPTTLHPWKAAWTVAAGVTVTGWNGTYTQDGTTVDVVAPDWAGGLAPGESIEIGHVGHGAPQPAATTSVELNGSHCQISG